MNTAGQIGSIINPILVTLLVLALISLLFALETGPFPHFYAQNSPVSPQERRALDVENTFFLKSTTVESIIGYGRIPVGCDRVATMPASSCRANGRSVTRFAVCCIWPAHSMPNRCVTVWNS